MSSWPVVVVWFFNRNKCEKKWKTFLQMNAMGFGYQWSYFFFDCEMLWAHARMTYCDARGLWCSGMNKYDAIRNFNRSWKKNSKVEQYNSLVIFDANSALLLWRSNPKWLFGSEHHIQVYKVHLASKIQLSSWRLSAEEKKSFLAAKVYIDTIANNM